MTQGIFLIGAKENGLSSDVCTKCLLEDEQGLQFTMYITFSE